MPVFTTPPNPMPSLWKVCHYDRHTFFQFDMEKGEVKDYHQQRNILVGEDFIVALLKGLEHEVGESAGWLLYTIGLNWGKTDAKEFEKWFYQYYNLTFATANINFALETWWWPLTAQGWGKWHADLSSLREGFIFIDLFDSAIAKTLGYIGKPVCHLYAGLMAGFFSVIFDKNLSSTEVQCYAMGNDFCRFLVGSEKRIRATEFWLSSGATVGDIEHKFATKEIPDDTELLVVEG